MDDVLQAGDRIGRTFIFYYMMGVAAIPFWQWLAKKYGKHRSLAIAMTWSALMVLATAFLGAGDYYIFLVFFVLKGASFGAVDKIGIAIGLFIALQILNLTGFDPSQEVNEAGLWMIRLEYAVIPTFFFVLASVLVWNYPVTSARHANLIEALERRQRREAQT